MPRLSIDDFKLFSVTCELRYNSAFLIYDRTGHIVEDLRPHFNDIAMSTAGPVQSAFVSEKGTFNLEIGASRFTSNASLQKNGEIFARHCQVFFDSVTTRLGIEVFTRVGLRYVARKEFGTLDEAAAALASCNLANLKPTKRFNSSGSPTEVLFRWEDKEIGAFIRLRAESGEVKFTPSPEMRDYLPSVDKRINVLTLDMDYYTVAAVRREQWNCTEWLQTKIRMIKKEADAILG